MLIVASVDLWGVLRNVFHRIFGSIETALTFETAPNSIAETGGCIKRVSEDLITKYFWQQPDMGCENTPAPHRNSDGAGGGLSCSP